MRRRTASGRRPGTSPRTGRSRGVAVLRAARVRVARRLLEVLEARLRREARVVLREPSTVTHAHKGGKSESES